jgi:curved DNA-binding protein CbpA
MSLTKYYKTLGLPPGADQAAIRKAFRKLAMRYHPDKNPSASAKAKFIMITEAYEILTGKKSAPTQRISRAKSSQNRSGTVKVPNDRIVKTQADRVREAKERQDEQAKREHAENERYFKLLTTGWRWRIMRWSAILGIILSVGLITEQFLPDHYSSDEITHYALHSNMASGNEKLSIVETAADDTYWISRMNYDLYGRHNRVYVRSSWIYHEPIQLLSIGKVDLKPYNVHYSFYSNFILIVFLFLLPGLTLLMKNRTILFTIVHQVSFYGVNTLMLYFLFRNDHWAHFITLGFL